MSSVLNVSKPVCSPPLPRNHWLRLATSCADAQSGNTVSENPPDAAPVARAAQARCRARDTAGSPYFRTEERVKSGPGSVSPPGAECDRAAPSQPMRPHGRLSPAPWPRKRHALRHQFRRPAKDDGPCERRTPSPGRGPNRGLRRVPAREPDGQATFSQPSEIKALFPKQVTKGLLLDRKVAFEGWTRAASPEDPYPIAGRRLARSWLPAPAGRSGRRGGATAGHDGDPDPTSAGTAGDAALWGGSSAAVGMAANPFGAHQAGRHKAGREGG